MSLDLEFYIVLIPDSSTGTPLLSSSIPTPLLLTP